MKTFSILALSGLLATAGPNGCDRDSDSIQREQQERILAEGTSAVGMPAVRNFRERRLLKDIIELRDQDGLATYTYIVAEATGKLVFLGHSIGYGIPASTQYTNPMKYYTNGVAIPQADPNGLFSPASSDGTWVMMKSPNTDEVLPVFVEPRCIVSPFPLSTN